MLAAMQVDLSGRRAIVTGAASGIGRAIAEGLATGGARVLVADLDEAEGRRVADRLAGAAFHRADVASRDDCRALVDRCVDLFGGVDILVNNAGLQHMAPVEEFPEDRWEQLIRVMLIGSFLLTKYALPHMYRGGWGRIVNMASIHGLVASPYKSAYTAAKHGLIGLTKTVALEAGERGVTVNAVCPSYVRTPLVERQIADQAKAHGIEESRVVSEIMLAPAAVKRLLEPGEVAAYVLFLCSDDASGITGSAQVIDAGWTAR
jgi:3-hydroxybutyrate dehydrogenase